jgi:adenylyltransferase/sulfurtransferase
MTARELLRGAGFGRVKSLAGGIDAWAARVDPEAARY